MIDGTENPKFLRSLQKAQRTTMNLAITAQHSITKKIFSFAKNRRTKLM